MPKEMLINVVEREECRIAVVADGVLQELYMERASSGSHVGSIYKGKITNVEPSIQAAFVDFGAVKNGFLHISDVQPNFFPGARGTEQVGKKMSRDDRPPIQECLRRGQEIIVQVTKEGIGTKGPTLTTYLSVPGRFLVMMPGMSHHGVSRKIEDEEQRHKMREILDELKPPSNMGFIVRTAGMDRSKKDLQQDLNYLLRLWQSVEKRLETAKAPAELYQESDLVIRTIRDIYSSEISQIVCDNERVAVKVAEFLNVVMPRGKNTVRYYSSPTPLFHRYNLEQEIEKIYSRRVELIGGSSLVIDQTEALVAIDVNSGRYRQATNAEETAYKTNIVAAKEIARQLRLRDMGGVIIIDFIDMREDRHRREIERVLRDAVKNDRARTKILKISRFGIVEMTRQRVRPSLRRSIYRDCPFCKAAGLIKSDESLALDVLRNLQLACADDTIATIELAVSPAVAEFLNNYRRVAISALESRTGKNILIRANSNALGDEVVFRCSDGRGSLVAWDPAAASKAASTPAGAAKKPGAAPSGPLVEEMVEIVDSTAQLPHTEGDEEEELAPEIAPIIEQAAAPLPSQQAAAGEVEGELAVARKKRRRRGGRKHRRRREAKEGQLAAADQAGAETHAEQTAEDLVERVAKEFPVDTAADRISEEVRVQQPTAATAAQAEEPAPADEPGAGETSEKTGKPHRRRRRRSKAAAKPVDVASEAEVAPAAPAEARPAERVEPKLPAEPKEEAAKAPAEPVVSEAEAGEAEPKPAAKTAPKRRRRRTTKKAAKPPADEPAAE